MNLKYCCIIYPVIYSFCVVSDQRAWWHPLHHKLTNRFWR